MADMPQRRNQGSFTSLNQPASRVGEVSSGRAPTKSPAQGRGRPKGRRNKKTEAQEAFKALGYDPTKVQVALAQRLEEMLVAGINDDGKPFKVSERCALLQQLANLNDKLMSYQSSKAGVEVEEYVVPADEDEDGVQEAEVLEEPRQLTAKDLLESRRAMNTHMRLKDRLG